MYCSTASSWLGLSENTPKPRCQKKPRYRGSSPFPFRGCFLYLFDQLRLGDSSWQRRDNVNVINNTAYAHKFSAEIAADCGQICMYARPHV